MALRRRLLFVAAGLIVLLAPTLAGGTALGLYGQRAAAAKPVTIGVIQITLTHGYQKVLNAGYQAESKRLGAKMRLCINNLNPSQNVTCAEDLLSAGVNVIIDAPADPSSFQSVVRLAKAKGIPVINDGSPEKIQSGVVPFTGTDSVGAGREDGQFAVNWIKKNLGGKAQVAELTLPTFTDCQNRNKGFRQAIGNLKSAPIVASANGHGLRANALPATESMLSGHPAIDVVFGCNDDSALGALSALAGKHKNPAKTLVVGVDGTLEAFQEIAKHGMFRADVAQRPDCYSRRMMNIAVKLARHQAKVQQYIKKGYFFEKVPLVTASNVRKWMKWAQSGDPKDAPASCQFSTNHQ